VLGTGVVSSVVAVARGGGGAGAPGWSMSPANVFRAIVNTSNAANTRFLTGFIDLLLKSVVSACEWVRNQVVLVICDNIRQSKALQGSLPD